MIIEYNFYDSIQIYFTSLISPPWQTVKSKVRNKPIRYLFFYPKKS